MWLKCLCYIELEAEGGDEAQEMERVKVGAGLRRAGRSQDSCNSICKAESLEASMAMSNRHHG